jgi:hypothetical protein
MVTSEGTPDEYAKPLCFLTLGTLLARESWCYLVVSLGNRTPCQTLTRIVANLIMRAATLEM